MWHSGTMRGAWVSLVIAVLGTVAAFAGAMIASASGRLASASIVDLAICLTYLYGGLLIWARDPGNRTGTLMIAIGYTWNIGTLAATGIPGVTEVAIALGDTPTAFLFILVLSYPTGRFERTTDRLAALALATGITALNVLQLVPSPIWINENPNGYIVGLSLTVVATALTVRHWATAKGRARREMLPVLVAGVVLGVTLLLNSVRRIYDVPDDIGALLLAVKDAAPVAIPIALLIGFYRQSEQRLRALVDAVPDRMFRFTRDGRYLAPRFAGSAGFAPESGAPSDRQLHELMFATAGEVAHGSAARALDSGMLQGYDFSVDLPDGRRDFEARLAPSGPDEVTAIVRDFTHQRAAETELRRSRTRIVEATDAERRRLERDLHDGAQQRLVSVSLALRLLRTRLRDAGDRNEAAIAASEEASGELKTAIEELRNLARGIHPAILTEAGLGAAITALAERSSVPASVTSLPDRRLPAAVEAAGYFVVSEALVNIAKYASATHANIAADFVGSSLRVEVGDDGVGGADPSRGTGIRGLEDRVGAVGGRLTVQSPAGQGTLVVAEIPFG